MNNDLISRSALKEHKFPAPLIGDYQQGWNDAIDAIIDNAPAVEETVMVDKSNFLKEQYNADLQSAYDCGYERGKNERQKGEWIDHSNDYGYVECPFCHVLTNCDYNPEELHYCWNCGAENCIADIRKGEQE